MDFFNPSGQSKGSEDENLTWLQLALIGVAALLVLDFFLDRPLV
ncbi:hypothetical protein ABG775_15755 [Peribacillus simplex]|nr:hypothetical protein [Brevibacillus sp. JNUCC-41]